MGGWNQTPAKLTDGEIWIMDMSADDLPVEHFVMLTAGRADGITAAGCSTRSGPGPQDFQAGTSGRTAIKVPMRLLWGPEARRAQFQLRSGFELTFTCSCSYSC